MSSSSNRITDSSENILVVAKSARMLARYLVDAGYSVVAVDCFGDSDTRQMARDFLQVQDLSLEQVRHAVEFLKGRHGLTYAIYGSGFERQPDSLNFLETVLQLLGNVPACFNAVQDKVSFFRLLDRLQIDYPEVSYTSPADSRQWLQKPLRGEGGLGVARYRAGAKPCENGVYWQRYIEGEPLSVLFLAAYDEVDIIGYQQQWLTGHSGHEFVFAGVISRSDLPSSVRAVVEKWVVELARHFRLKGLNSLDFMLARGRCYMLEINARPPASLQLYGPEQMAAHIRAVAGGVLESGGRSYESAAYRIIYAQQEIRIGRNDNWPEWVADRPIPGSTIGQGEPICSIIARAENRRQLMEKMQYQLQQIEQFLATGYESHAIRSKRK